MLEPCYLKSPREVRTAIWYGEIRDQAKKRDFKDFELANLVFTCILRLLARKSLLFHNLRFYQTEICVCFEQVMEVERKRKGASTWAGLDQEEEFPMFT